MNAALRLHRSLGELRLLYRVDALKMYKRTDEHKLGDGLRDSGKDTLFLVAPYDGCSNL
jgi:hypothetical protein